MRLEKAHNDSFKWYLNNATIHPKPPRLIPPGPDASFQCVGDKPLNARGYLPPNILEVFFNTSVAFSSYPFCVSGLKVKYLTPVL